jgi:hypothetical protein
MQTQQFNRISIKVIIGLCFVALLAVITGYMQPPQPDERSAAHIFQIAIVLLAPTILVFLLTLDWKKPLSGTRPLAFPAAILFVAFAALYYLERYWQ